VSKTTKLATAGGVPVHAHQRSFTGNLPLARRAQSFLGRVRWRRFFVRVLLTLAIPCALYVVVANVLLRTGLLRNVVSGSSVSFAVIGDSTDLRLDYTSAYSIVPGRVHVEGLTIRGREQTMEWFLTLDHADVRISLGDLLHRTFHVTRLRSSGFVLRARMRLDRADATPEVVATLPPIEGFPDAPVLDEGPEPPPLTDATYNLWTINLEDVDVDHVRQIWIQALRAEGDTHVTGRWFFHPQRWLDVGPATVDANGVDFSYGSAPLATGVRGSFGATVHPFDLRQADGLEVLDHVSYDGQLRGRGFVADVLRLLAPRSGIRFTRWEGPFDARLILDHGTVANGTQVSTEADDCAIGAGALVLEAPIRTELGVQEHLATIDMRVSGAGAERAHIASIAVAVTSGELQLAHLGGDARFAVDVGGATTNDIAAWQHYFPSTSTFAIRSGTVAADAHAKGSLVEGGGWAAGTATVAADDVTVALGPAVLGGRLEAHVDLRRATWADRRVELSGSDVVLRSVSARSAGGEGAVLIVPSLTAVAPRLVLAPSGVDGQVSIDLPRADLDHLGGLGELVSLPKGITIENGRGRAKLHADVELGTGSARADGNLVLRGLRGHALSAELFGDLDCTLKARRSGGPQGSTDLSGSTLAMTHAGTGKGMPLEEAWWARGALKQATLWTGGGVRFDGKVHVTAKDASPATAIVSQNTAVPAWAADIFRMPVLDADAEVRVAPSSFEVRSLLAHGGKTSVRAEYARRNGRQDGGALLDLGWIDLGYDLAEGSTGLVLVGPDAWFGRKVATLRDAAAAARSKADTTMQLARYAAMTPALRGDEARTLAAQCTLEARSCDGTSIESLLRAAPDARERDTLGGIAYAPMVVAAAKGGKDGTTLDPRVVGSVGEALRMGGQPALDDIPAMAPVAAASDSDAARGKVVVVAGHVSSIRREGTTSVGTLTTDAEPVYFVTPFATDVAPENPARFRGVFVQRYTLADGSQGRPSLVLVGVFDHP